MKPRPKLFLNPALLALAAIGTTAVLARGGAWFVAAVVALAAAWLLVTWLLFPYSAWARRVRLPPAEVFEQHAQAHAARKRTPLIGSVYRGLSRITDPAAMKAEAKYKAWVKAERQRLGMDET
jgi:hypothetical protein